MTNQNTGLDMLVSAIELAAPSLATLMGGPLGGALATGVVNALQAGGIGAELPAPVTPSAMAPAALEAPLSLLQSLLQVLDQQASDHLNEVTAVSPAAGAPATPLPRNDSGTVVNSTDNISKLCVSVIGAIVAVIGLSSPNTASFLSQYVPVAGGLATMVIGALLSHRTVNRTNINTVAVQSPK